MPAGSLSGQIKLQGLHRDLVGTLPLTERFSVLARVGAQAARARDSFSGTGAVTVTDPNPSKRSASYKFGAGLQYAFSPSVWLRGEAERYRVNDAVANKGDVNMFSVSLVFPFGRTPAPVAPVVVAPPEGRRVSFSAESLFTFDKSELRPEGKTALDTFASELTSTRFDTITVEGHTDRLGSPAYNQKLSQRRADAVKDYLVASGKVDSAKVSSVGVGESMPTTRPEDCKGNKASATLIACLQPDRRVEIEVVGTR